MDHRYTKATTEDRGQMLDKMCILCWDEISVKRLAEG